MNNTEKYIHFSILFFRICKFWFHFEVTSLYAPLVYIEIMPHPYLSQSNWGLYRITFNWSFLQYSTDYLVDIISSPFLDLKNVYKTLWLINWPG